MATSKTLQIILQLKDDATKKLGGFGSAIERNGEQIKAVGRGMVVAGAAITGLAGVAIKSASDLGESVNAVNVVFGKAAEGVLKLSENSAKAVGLSKTQFNGLAVQFSSFAEKIAGKGGDVAKVIDDITKRSADFASVMNVDVADAARIFQSALAGETEPIKKYGIDLSAAAIEAYALAKGMKKGKEELTEQQKVLARYGLLMEQTNKTQGDFVNTQGGIANSSRVLRATMSDISAQIGQALVPAMEKAAAAIKPIVEKMAEWIKTHPDLAGKIAIVVAAIGAFLLVVGPLLIILPAVAAAIGFVSTALLFLAANPIVLVIAAIVAVIAAIVLLIKHWDEVKAFLPFVWEQLKDYAEAIWGAIKDFFVSIWEAIKGVFVSAWTSIKEFLAATWESIKAAAAAAWEAIKTVMAVALRAMIAAATLGLSELVLSIVKNWDDIKAKTAAAWGAIKDSLAAAWEGIKSTATGAWNGIKAAIQSVIDSIKGIFTSLASSALAWGENMMSSFVQGIRNKIGAAKQAAKDAAAAVAGFLGFSSPTKEGPGRNVDKWGGNMIQAIADGMLEKRQLLRSVASSMLTGMPGTLSAVGGTAGRPITSGGAGSAGAARGGNTFIFNGVTLQGTTRQQADQLFDLLQKRVNNSLKT